MKTYEQFKEYMADGQDDAHDQEIFLLNLKADLLEIENDLERELDTINQPPYSFYNFNVDDLTKEQIKDWMKTNDVRVTTNIPNDITDPDVVGKVDSLLIESSDNELKIKLDNVKKEVSGMSPSKYNYYRLTELKNGLN